MYRKDPCSFQEVFFLTAAKCFSTGRCVCFVSCCFPFPQWQNAKRKPSHLHGNSTCKRASCQRSMLTSIRTTTTTRRMSVCGRFSPESPGLSPRFFRLKFSVKRFLRCGIASWRYGDAFSKKKKKKISRQWTRLTAPGPPVHTQPTTH